MMRTEYSRIIKNSDAYKRLIKDMERGSFSHAYLIVTNDALAADALLTEVCLTVYCKEGGCGRCSDCIKVLKGAKPDLKEPNKDGAALKVEDINAVVADSYLTAFEKCEKIYILRNLENTSERAQNKLLKTLEEPSSNVHFLLTASSVQGILPTVASRVKQLPLGAFGEQDIYECLKGMGVEESAAKLYARSSQGSLTVAVRLSSDGVFFEKAEVIIDLLYGLQRSEDTVKYILNPVFSDGLEEAISIMEFIFEDLLHISCGRSLLNFPSFQKKIIGLSQRFNAKSITSCLNCLFEARRKIRANCIKTNIIDALLISILEVCKKCV